MNEDRTQRIGKAFGAAAGHYEEHAGVQRIVAETLAQLLRVQPVRVGPDGRLRILEIGCGTGLLTRHLRSLFPDSEIIATDIAPEMIAEAERGGSVGAQFLVMDGEAPGFAGAHFDLIASSLAFEWFADLPCALDRLTALLRPGGSLMFATMACRSFHEWRAAHEALGFQVGTPLYPEVHDLRAMLGKHRDAFLFEEEYAHDFGGARGLLEHLKGIGATVPVAGREPLNAGKLRKVMRVYDEAGGICTYHVAFARVTQLMEGNI